MFANIETLKNCHCGVKNVKKEALFQLENHFSVTFCAWYHHNKWRNNVLASVNKIQQLKLKTLAFSWNWRHIFWHQHGAFCPLLPYSVMSYFPFFLQHFLESVLDFCCTLRTNYALEKKQKKNNSCTLFWLIYMLGGAERWLELVRLITGE